MLNNLINIDVYYTKLKKVVSMQMEKVVKLLVAAHYSSDFEFDFLKIQSIIYRTQLARKMRAFGGKGCSKHDKCDICDSGHCVEIVDEKELQERWKDSYAQNFERISNAVDETEGLIITINNKPIDAKYNDICGGSTENSENVLGYRIDYLRKVLCDYCLSAPNLLDSKEFSTDDIEELLGLKFPKNDEILDIETKGFIDNIKRDDEGRIITMDIAGKKFKGTEIMNLLDLNSTKFSVLPTNFRFNTIGKGDGLGLCQYGANEMVKQGYNYEDIINYYFTGVKIKKLEKPCINKPLKGKIFIVDPGHGGENSGDFKGENGLREKVVVLQISKSLKQELNKLGAKVYLTREKDDYVTLKDRVNFANKIRPEFFLSIHMNSFPNSSIHGCEAYCYKDDEESRELSKDIIQSIEDRLGVINRGVKTANFYILRHVGVNCIHLEVDYISNINEEKKFKDESYIKKVAKAIAAGISKYYKY